jgi:large subunit ribosomal protein L29
MKYAELTDLTAEELTQKAAGLQEELFKLRLRQATSQVENPMRIRQLRRDIARIRTAQRALSLRRADAPRGGPATEATAAAEGGSAA